MEHCCNILTENTHFCSKFCIKLLCLFISERDQTLIYMLFLCVFFFFLYCFVLLRIKICSIKGWQICIQLISRCFLKTEWRYRFHAEQRGVNSIAEVSSFSLGWLLPNHSFVWSDSCYNIAYQPYSP